MPVSKMSKDKSSISPRKGYEEGSSKTESVKFGSSIRRDESRDYQSKEKKYDSSYLSKDITRYTKDSENVR